MRSGTGRALRSTLLGVLCLLTASCGMKGRVELAQALRELSKVSAGLEAGATLEQYGQLLITAQAEVNEALDALPEGETRTNLSRAMEAFVDARRVWSLHAERGAHLTDKNELGEELIPKYHIPTRPVMFQGEVVCMSANVDVATQWIWARAESLLQVVRSDS
jgi:hypothetical protein